MAETKLIKSREEQISNLLLPKYMDQIDHEETKNNVFGIILLVGVILWSYVDFFLWGMQPSLISIERHF